MFKKLALNALLLGICSSTWADSSSQRLILGMTCAQASSIKGEPQAILEQESLRRTVWVYPDDKLIFKEGRLIRSNWLEGAKSTRSLHANSEAAAHQAVGTRKDSNLSKTSFFSVDNTKQKAGSLGQMMRELPSEDSSAVPGGGAPGMPGKPQSSVEIMRPR